LTALVLLFVAAGLARPDFIYWSEFGRGRIGQANLDGTQMTILLTRAGGAFGPALDFAGGMVWGNYFGDIRRANLDGTGQTILIKGAPQAPVLDLASGQMYWTDQPLGVIQRANLDGTGLVTLITGLPGPNQSLSILRAGRCTSIAIQAA
jgi:hypothetical protein